MRILSLICISFSYLLDSTQSRSAEEWKSRIIYQILTDRFSPTDNLPSKPCTALRSYCGGTFSGIVKHLDYIEGLGANAIWISPMIENTEGGFHGYWAKNIYKVNPYFGTEEELKNLISECHKRDIWVMLDVVANHMGYPYNCSWSAPCTTEQLLNFTGFHPFDKDGHYHEICEIRNFKNQTEVELCRLAQLPDLNQSDSYVRQTLLQWIHNLTQYYKFDGYRIDTVVEVEKGFWTEFQQAAGAYCLGEANNGNNVTYVAAYQGPLDAVLNFPVYFELRKVFNEGNSFLELQQSLQEQTMFKSYSDFCGKGTWTDNIIHNLQKIHFKDTTNLGLFIDNHDFPRFLHLSPDLSLLKNALTYVLLGEGIPIIYYGTEQEFAGRYDPYNRESLWPYMNSSFQMYKFIGHISKFRLKSGIDFKGRNQRELFADNDTMVFSRGNKQEAVVFLTRMGNISRRQTKTFTNISGFADGTVLQNIFDCSDTVSIIGNSVIITYKNGQPLVYVQKTQNKYTECGKCSPPLSHTCDSNHMSYMQNSGVISLISVSLSLLLIKLPKH